MFRPSRRRPSKLLRKLKQGAKASNYAAAGLNGTRAQARRLRQMAKQAGKVTTEGNDG